MERVRRPDKDLHGVTPFSKSSFGGTRKEYYLDKSDIFV
jgi:hypothetical protein